MPKNPQNSPFLLGNVDPHLIHECLAGPTHHPKRQLDRCTHFRITTQQSPHWLQWDAPNSPPQYTFRTDRQTHRHFRRQVSNNSAYARYSDREQRANNKTRRQNKYTINKII